MLYFLKKKAGKNLANFNNFLISHPLRCKTTFHA